MVKAPKSMKVNALTLAALITAAAVIMHALEAMLPPLIPGVPVKLGLANVFTLLALILIGAPHAFAVSVLRCLIGALITGAVSQLPYSLTGAVLSFFAMFSLEHARKREIVSPVGQSVFGAFLFNIGQLAVGTLIAGRAMLYYFPIMSLLSVPTGIFTGLTVYYFIKAFKRKRNEQ